MFANESTMQEVLQKATAAGQLLEERLNAVRPLLPGEIVEFLRKSFSNLFGLKKILNFAESKAEGIQSLMMGVAADRLCNHFCDTQLMSLRHLLDAHGVDRDTRRAALPAITWLLLMGPMDLAENRDPVPLDMIADELKKREDDPEQSDPYGDFRVLFVTN